MKCINCGEEAGRKGNRHVKSRTFTCTRMVKRLETKRKWYGAREENWVVVETASLDPVDCGLTNWRSSDDYVSSYSDSRFEDSYSPRTYDHTPSKSDDSWSSSRSYDSPSHSSWDSGSSSGSSWSSSGSSSSDSSSSGSNWGSSSGSSSSDSGSSSSSSSSSSDSGGW